MQILHCPKSPVLWLNMRRLEVSLPLAKRGGIRHPALLYKASNRLSSIYRKIHWEVSDKAAQSSSNQEPGNVYTQVLVKSLQYPASSILHPPSQIKTFGS